MPWLFVILGLVACISSMYGLITAVQARRRFYFEALELALLAGAWLLHHTTLAGWIALGCALGLEALRRLPVLRQNPTSGDMQTVAEAAIPIIESPPGPPPMVAAPPLSAPVSYPPPMPLPAPLPPTPPPPSAPPLISIALLRSIWQPSPDVFLASLRRGGERGAKLASSAPIRLSVNDLTLELECVARPLPRTQINDAAAQSWDWPDAAKIAGPHAAHVNFTTRADAGASRAASLRLHCRAQQALAEFAPVIAVLWPAAGRLIPVAALAKLIATPGDFDLAKATCLNFRTFPLEGPEAGRYLCDTVGFSAFGLADLEVECEGQPGASLTDAIYGRAQEMFKAEEDINPDGAMFEYGGASWRIERTRSRFSPDRDVARWLSAST